MLNRKHVDLSVINDLPKTISIYWVIQIAFINDEFSHCCWRRKTKSKTFFKKVSACLGMSIEIASTIHATFNGCVRE